MFGWDEYHDTRRPGSYSYGGSLIAKDLAKVLKSSAIASLISSQRQLRSKSTTKVNRRLQGESAQCIGSYGKDWTLGGSTARGVWKAHCGCKQVPWQTPHNDLLSCIDAWASEANGCRRVGVNGVNAFETLPEISVGENAFCGDSVKLSSSGRFESLPEMPHRVSLSLKMSRSKHPPTCLDLIAAEGHVRTFLCTLNKNAYRSADGEASPSAECARSTASTKFYVASLENYDECRKQLKATSQDVLPSKSVQLVEDGNRMSPSTFLVDVTLDPSFPLATLTSSSDVQSYSGTQRRLAEMVFQQIQVIDSVSMLSAHFADFTAEIDSGREMNVSPVEEMKTFTAEDCDGKRSSNWLIISSSIAGGCLVALLSVAVRRHRANASRGKRLGSRPTGESSVEVELRSSTDRKLSTFNKLMMGPPPGVAQPSNRGNRGESAPGTTSLHHPPPVPRRKCNRCKKRFERERKKSPQYDDNHEPLEKEVS